MARTSEIRDEIDGAARELGTTARALTSHARRAARAATSEAARAIQDNRDTVRTVFHDLADEAEARSRDAEKKAGAIAERVKAGVSDAMREGRGRPIATVALVAVTAALASALAASVFTRR